MTDRLHAAFAAACFGKGTSFRDDLAGFLAAHDVDADDAAALLASPRRLALYRKLVRHNVTSVIETMLEHTKARLERRLPGELDRAIADFLAEVGPRTAHLRDVPAEFLAFIAPRWREGGRVPRWLVDHAELELVEFTVGVAPRPLPPPPLADVTADRPLVFAEPKRIVRLAWAVSDLDREDLAAEPEERAVTILVYRDAEHRSRFLDLTPLAASILERLIAGEPLGQAITAACQADGHPLDDSVLAGAARLLSDLGERGVLLGARAADAT